MAGRGKELGFVERNGVINLKEQLARTALRNVRLKGHTYVELREDNKKVIFFCVLCLSPCYSDSVLHDHLRGHLHKQMYEAAKATLLKQNPFPFNDGMLFFHTEDGVERRVVPSNGAGNGNCLAIVPFEGNESENEFSSEGSLDLGQGDEGVDVGDLVIPDVLCKDKVSDLEVREVGVGKISVRFWDKDKGSKGIKKIWCEWLGKNGSVDDDMISYHDFAVVSFAFDFDLGRKGVLDELQDFLSSSSRLEIEGNKKGKKRKSPSDTDLSESLSNQEESSGEESGNSNSKNLLDVYDDKSLQLRLVPDKYTRKEIRTRQRLASERVCDICQHKMLPGKNVATLLNMKTGRIVCSSRNLNGAFHVFHISCLIHWILLCESEVYTKQLVGPEPKRRSRRKKGAKSKKVDEDVKKQIYSAFCPECQGTGIELGGDELEKPTVSLSEMFKYKMKASDGHKEYIIAPELLQNCSTGFYFPSQSEEAMQENVSPLKLLRFYHAVE
ncbi:putative transcription factor C2H2 family [Helianthus annuus]|nr:putative transcription factor C2H2 family [Helianthus annuus]KAJ0636734.1 putative transcription factor C2H2 family [Helianthus annuus]